MIFLNDAGSKNADVVAKFDPRFELQESFRKNVGGLLLRTNVVNRNRKSFKHLLKPMHVDPVCARDVSELC